MASGIRIPLISDWDPSGVNKAKRDFQKLETTGQKVSFGLKKAFLPATAALGGLAVAGAQFINAGERASTSNARIREIAESMGLFGQETEQVTNRLVELAEAQARATGVDQNAIKETQAKLLTFKELADTADEVGGAFDRTTTLALDLAAAGFGSAEQNAVQLGKALNDPVAGLSALTRSGITFTAAEKEMIAALVESGKTFEAQDMILKAIETQVGGTAEATANSTDKLKVGFSQLSEQLGMALLPILESLMPVLMGMVDFIGNNTGLVIGLGVAIGSVASAIVIANVAMKAYAAFQAIVTAAQWAWNVALSANPIGLVVAAIAAVIAIVIVLQKKFDIFGKAVAGLKYIFEMLWDAVKWVFSKIIDGINLMIRAWNKLPLVPDIAEIDKAFLGMQDTVDETAKVVGKSMEEISKEVGSAEGEAARFRNQLQDVGDTMEEVGRTQVSQITQHVEGFSKALTVADQKLRTLYNDLKREEAADAFSEKMQELEDAVGTDGFEKALRDAKLAVFDLETQVGGFSTAIAEEFQIAIDTGDFERLDLLILSIKENWSAFSGTRAPTWSDLSISGEDFLARAEQQALDNPFIANLPGGFGGMVSSTNITVVGVGEEDVTRAVANATRRRGSVPGTVSGNRARR